MSGSRDLTADVDLDLKGSVVCRLAQKVVNSLVDSVCRRRDHLSSQLQ